MLPPDLHIGADHDVGLQRTAETALQRPVAARALRARLVDGRADIGPRQRTHQARSFLARRARRKITAIDKDVGIR